MSQYHLLLRLSNTLVFIFFLGGNIYTAFGPKSPAHTLHLSYLTPAPYTFLVWSLIHLLLGGYIIYQWFDAATEIVKNGVGWHFVTASLLNALWLWLWTNDHTFWAWITLFFVSGAISFVYYRIKENFLDLGTVWDNVFVHLPFSLYHAWVFVLLILNTFATFSPVKEDGPSTLQVVFAILGLIFMASTVVGYIEYKTGDVAGALVLAWSLIGIYEGQDDGAIRYTALVLGALVAIYTLKPFVKRFLGYRAPESAPLLG